MADLLNISVQSAIPVGTIIKAVGPPDSTWKRCNGEVLLQSSYPAYVASAYELHPRKWMQWEFVDIDQSINETYKYRISIMGNTIVVVGGGSKVWYSTDSGSNWSTNSPLGTGSHYVILNNGTNFVTVQSSSTTLYYSSDGSTWNTATLPISNTWYYGVYALGKFIIMPSGYQSSGSYVYSSNGTSWSSASLPFSGGYIKGLCADDNYYYMFAYDSSTWLKVYRSSDGTTWSAGTKDFLFGMPGYWSNVLVGFDCVNGKVVATFDGVPEYYVCEGTDPRDPDHYIRCSGSPMINTYSQYFGLLRYDNDGRYVFANYDQNSTFLVGKDVYDLTGTRSNMHSPQDLQFKSDGSVGICIPEGFSSLTWRSIGYSTGVPYNDSTHFQLPFESMYDEPRITHYIKVAE
jgi:hypothetical protein